MYKEKSILISEDVHEKLKEYSKKTGIKMKILTETAILRYLHRLKIDELPNKEEDMKILAREGIYIGNR